MGSPIPPNVNDPALYQKIKDEIHAQDAAAGRQWGAYSSGRLVQEYKKRGGTYSGKKKSPRGYISKRSPRGEGGLRQWFDEEWVDEYGNECGSTKNKNTKKCRPRKRVNKDTPATWEELTDKEKAKAIAEKKKVGMGKRASPIKRSREKAGMDKKTSPNKRSRKRSAMGVLENAPSDFTKTKPLYKPYLSTRSTKKGMVYVKDSNNKCGKKLIHFGDASMSDFTKHKSPERRKNYRTRSAGIRDAEGHLTKDDKNSANYWSRKINW